MKILYSWLKEFVDTRLSPREVQEALTMAGVEVSACRFLGEGLSDVVVARILSMERHPNADKLSLCRVTDGTGEYDIVCGARNMKAGDGVALARVGARLPNGVTIQKAKIRGRYSEGMLCSEQELHLADEAAGILILPPEAPLGAPLSEALGLSDWLLTVEITPNRGDCLSVLGVAREVASITGEEIALPSASPREEGPPVGSLAEVRVTDADLCPRYSARVVTGLSVRESPGWMRRRLSLCGVRPINNLVDITNYLLLELGQPMHAFDLDRLAGRRIDVRRSGIPRTFTTLDGASRKIEEEMLLIWDGEGPVAVAGVMGGENTEVLPTTRDVLFESAHFFPPSIRRTSRRLGLSSESSYRFERGVDPSGTRYAADRAAALVESLSAGVSAKGCLDVGGGRSFAREVPFRPARASTVIGREYGEAECREVFRKLSFPVAESGPGLWSVTAPPHRFDLEREIDLIEEVARLVGYESIPTTYPRSGAPDISGEDRFLARVEEAGEFLRSRGFSQAINLSFVPGKAWKRHAALLGFHEADGILLANPISEETTLMRPHLLTGLLANVDMNLRRFSDDLRLFEVGKAFGRRYAPTHFEEERIAFVLQGARVPGNWWGDRSPVDFFDGKGVAEGLLAILGQGTFHFVPAASSPFLAPGKSAEILADGEVVGWVGAVRQELLDALEIPPPVCYGEIRLRLAARPGGARTFSPIPKFPPVFRDLAFVFPGAVPVGDVLTMAREAAPEVAEVQVFDVYTGEKIGEGRKSVAFRVKLLSPERTLTEEEVNRIHTKIVNLLENRFGGTIRSS